MSILVRCIDMRIPNDETFAKRLDDVFGWISENALYEEWQSESDEHYVTFSFENEELATAFKLRFGL